MIFIELAYTFKIKFPCCLSKYGFFATMSFFLKLFIGHSVYTINKIDKISVG